MKKGMGYAQLFYKHVVPFTVAIRMVTLSTSGSLAIAATALPSVDGQLPITTNALVPQVVNSSAISVQDFLAETNTDRIANGLAPLQLNVQLVNAAQAKAHDMIINHYWDHFRPSDHKAPWDFITEAGYTYHYAGENLARGFKTAHGVTTAWMASPAHRANLLSPNFKDVGFATIMGTDDQGNPALYTVQLFGAK